MSPLGNMMRNIRSRRPAATARNRIDPAASPAQLIERHCADILASPTMQIEARCIQHGSTSVLAHSVAVTALALSMATRMRLPVHERALTRGSLLHDYFLYDWHDPEPWHKVHGFTHPFRACKNAIRDFDVSKHEQAIIRTHMFPLVPLPPTCREAVLLCLADKVVATKETVAGFGERVRAHDERRP